MLGTVVVHLKGKFRSRLNCNAFYLITMTVVDRVIFTPRPIDLAMNEVLTAFFAF
ncbi:hypothetical protein D9M68_677670 [compost metagenome]